MGPRISDSVYLHHPSILRTVHKHLKTLPKDLSTEILQPLDLKEANNIAIQTETEAPNRDYNPCDLNIALNQLPKRRLARKSFGIRCSFPTGTTTSSPNFGSVPLFVPLRLWAVS